MKPALLILLWLSVYAFPVNAQDRIYRCGNEYTNTVPDSKRGCKLVEGGNVTVVQGARVKTVPAKSSANMADAPASAVRVDAQDQKSRDSDARLILQSELKKAEARQQELTREYNNGEPEKRADESRNHQKYLDRVAEIKANLARNESDMAGIRRELGRLSVVATGK